MFAFGHCNYSDGLQTWLFYRLVSPKFSTVTERKEVTAGTLNFPERSPCRCMWVGCSLPRLWQCWLGPEEVDQAPAWPGLRAGRQKGEHGQWHLFVLKRIPQCHLETGYFILFFCSHCASILDSVFKGRKVSGAGVVLSSWARRAGRALRRLCREISRCFSQHRVLEPGPACGASCCSLGGQFWWLSLSSAVVNPPWFSLRKRLISVWSYLCRINE